MTKELNVNQVFIPTKEMADQIVSQVPTPVFVTSKQVLEDRVQQFKKAFSFNAKTFFAVKSNFNPSVLLALKDAGVDGIDTVSPYEIALAKRVGFLSSEIIFTGNGSSDEELKQVMQHEVMCNLGSLSELERFGRLFPGAKMSLRFNPGIGDGENEFVITGGQKSKFGILKRDFEIAKAIVQKHKLQLQGLHCHIGSGFYTTEHFSQAVSNILDQAKLFGKVSFIDLGGGFGVRYQSSAKPIDLPSFGASIESLVQKFEEHNGPVEIRFEPGKYLVAESTCLLTTVTTRKNTDEKDFVCVDTGFHHLIRPALYKSEHEIVNITRPLEEKKRVTVVGNVCESTDVFADEILLSNPKEGDILALISAGAYGSSMSSLYNLRPYASEVMMDACQIKVTRKTLTFDQLFLGLGYL